HTGWLCRTCWRPHPTAPSPTALADARQADRDVRLRARDLDALATQFRRQTQNDRIRDRRSLREVHAAMRAALLHRMLPDRYPLPRAASRVRPASADRLRATALGGRRLRRPVGAPRGRVGAEGPLYRQRPLDAHGAAGLPLDVGLRVAARRR